MKQLLNDIRTQPESVKHLISSMVDATIQRKEEICLLELDDQQKAWLRENGFPFSFNKGVMEWEIVIQDKEDK